ncbi:MAG: hypothetical protein KDD25_02955, partial [Bdellovibrionales bacterium]|nr:hypothetical protein [Bdellovibrionales bacterium]
IIIVPTFISGLGLLYIEKRLPIVFINISINCWICMNGFWILSEHHKNTDLLELSKFFFAVGMLCIVAAGFISGNLKETFSHFRRFRLLNHFKK